MSSLALDQRYGEPRRLRVLKGNAGPPSLIEREPELDALASAVQRLSDGRGGVVVIEAAAGLGKSALLEHVSRIAVEAGCAVRSAAPARLEREFAFGVIRALLEAPLRERSRLDRIELVGGAAAMAGALLLEGAVPDADATMTLAHSVLWLAATLAERRPLALLVDDAQWADPRSAEVLRYLGRRVDELPVLLVAAARGGERGTAAEWLNELAAVRSATVLRPRPLTAGGALTVIRRQAPETPTGVCCEHHRAAAGNPWLLVELGRRLAETDRAGSERSRAGSSFITDHGRSVVRSRMAELSPHDRAVAVALAVLGDDPPASALAALARIELDDLGSARDALRVAGLLSIEEMRFPHALIADAIADDLAPHERERLHRAAARALVGVEPSIEIVAGHLLRSSPDGDPVASDLLLRAAAIAAQRGAPDTAAAYLARALDERAPTDNRREILTRLATVAFDAGLPDARQRLREAFREADDQATRIEVLTRLAALGGVEAGDGSAVRVLERSEHDSAEGDQQPAIEAAALDMLLTMPDRSIERARRARSVTLAPGVDPLLRRAVTAHRAWVAAELGTPAAGVTAALALEALDGEMLLREASHRPGYHISTRALIMADRDEQAHAAIAALRQEAGERGSLRLLAAAAWYAAELALRSGRVAAAENDARLALGMVEGDVNVFTAGAVGVLVVALAERGSFDEARQLLRARRVQRGGDGRPWEIGVSDARARLWLYEGDFERSYVEAREVGALRERQGRRNPAWTPWRSTAALALAHLGRRREAARLADLELALAERFEAPVPIGRALHARAVAEPDDDRRAALCDRGLMALHDRPATLEAVRLRLELGSTLARTGRRIEARDALRPALADADAAGAVLLAQRARRELVATGLRPRRAAIEGVASLTPRQRQICDHAAAGMSNQAIAHALFLSIKTVETHLATAFRKLGVRSRTELPVKLLG